MEIKWVEDFIALSQYQSFSRAAEFRNVTQSEFSRRIQSLEQRVGADLTDRSCFPPTLTPAGQLFREAAVDILGKLFDTRAIIRIDQRMAGKGLQIAAGHTIALSFLPAWLKALTARFGEVRARVIPTNVHDSILMLVNGNCELMFAYHHPPSLRPHYESDMAEVLKKLVLEGGEDDHRAACLRHAGVRARRHGRHERCAQDLTEIWLWRRHRATRSGC